MRALLLAPLLLAAPAAAQTGRLLVDFGSDGQATGVRGAVWNDVTPSTAQSVHALVYDTGVPSGITLDLTAEKTSTSANGNGTTAPAPGSPLAALGWPASALRDSLYGSTSLPEVEFVLAGLDPTASYDFDVVCSRMGVTDVRTTTFTAEGAVTGSAVLDAANNDEELVTIRGVRPDGSGSIVFRYRAAATNTNSSRFFYLNALGISEWSGGSQPPLVAFATNRADVSRVQGKGPFAFELSTYTNDGTAPTVQLAAVDTATQAPPTWLVLPASAAAGASFTLTVDADALPVGVATAALSGTAPGYAPASASVVLAVRSADGYLNLLFYGNSYSIGNGGVHALVAALAEERGFESPNTYAALVGGQTLNYHLTNPKQAAAIQTLPLGEEWDFVVMQGFSTEATTALGNPAQFVADAVAILGNVRAHSPGARACMFQTWARGEGHSFYPGSFASPLEMHQQIEAGYIQAVEAMDAAYGPGSGRRGAAGEAIALLAFDPALYDPDLSHPGPAMSLMAGDTLFTAIYGVRACDVAVANPAGNLAQYLGANGIAPADQKEYAGIADRAADPWNRRYPGSREDLLLRTGRPELVTPCPLKGIVPGIRVDVVVESPIGTYDGAPLLIYADLFPTGSPPGPWAGAPEIQYDPGSAWVLASTPSLDGRFEVELRLPFWMVGRSLLIQGHSLAPSAKTGSPFTTTDGHELRAGPMPSRSRVK